MPRKHYLSLLFSAIFIDFVVSNKEFIVEFSVNLTKSQHVIAFGCQTNVGKYFHVASELNYHEKSFRFVNIEKNFTLPEILSRYIVASTDIFVELKCPGYRKTIDIADSYRYFNKSYQWIFMDEDGIGIAKTIENIKTGLSIGLNAQLTFVNMTRSADEIPVLELYDVHSKGLHLGSKLELIKFAEWSLLKKGFFPSVNLTFIQSMGRRKNFQNLTLRGVTVIDQDSVSSNQVDQLLSSSTRTDGISQFVKFHYKLVKLLQEVYNFSIVYRITRGWAGRLQSGYRLGLLGVGQRNEADIMATGIFNHINRFAEFDFILRVWKFEAGFLFRVTPDFSSTGGGNFLAPFNSLVWIYSALAITVLTLLWWAFASIKWRTGKGPRHCEVSLSLVFLRSIASISQQGFDAIPKSIAIRIIAIVLMLFSLLMYNFYTSSVVGGLLSTKIRGPETIDEITESPLILSFEDIGYHKVLFRENNSTSVQRLYRKKVLVHSGPLPVYAHVMTAVPYLKKGIHAFHCELIIAYPEIAKQFDASEICDLRTVTGLFQTEVMHMILPKRSMYTEAFRITLYKALEFGIVHRELAHRPEKPQCFSTAKTHAVNLNAVLSAFYLYIGGSLLSVFVLFSEIIWKFWLVKILATK